MPRRFPVSVPVRAGLSCLLLVLASFGTAPSVLAQVDAATRAERLFVRGMTRAYLDDHEGALALFQEAQRLAPGVPAVLAALAETYAALDDPATALFFATQAWERAPENPYYGEQVARLHLAAGDTLGALTTYEALLAAHPAYRPALRALASLLASQARYAEAAETLERLRTLEPARPSVLQDLLVLYERLHDEDGQERTLRTLLDLQPDHPEAYRRLAHWYLERERYEDALPLLETLRTLRPDDATARDDLARAYRATGRSDLAEALTGDAPPTTVVALLARAAPLLERAGNDPEAARAARDLLEQALTLEPQHAGAAEALGRLAFTTGDFGTAATYLGRLARRSPRRLDLWERAAEAALQAGDARAAADLADEALLFFPGNTILLRVAAFAALERQAPGEARRHFEEALTVLAETPDAPPAQEADLRSGLGLALALLNQPEAAEEAFRRALDLAPDLVPALLRYGDALDHLGRREEARAVWRRALNLAPDHPELRARLQHP